MSINERIKLLRREMKAAGLDAYIIPTSDPHQSEYVAEHWKSREWVSGFTGSAGLVVITDQHAGLWTDSRYFLQAETELSDSEMVLHKMLDRTVAPHVIWLADTLSANAVVGLDGYLFSKGQQNQYQKILDQKEITINFEYDLIAKIWNDRPALPLDPVFEHPVKYAGKSRDEKLEMIRAKMQETGAKHHLVTTLDDIAWIFNIRGSDVSYNPVCIAYAIVHEVGATLFVNAKKLPQDVLRVLAESQVQIKAYEDIVAYLNQMPEDESILVDTGNCSIKIYRAINSRIIPGKTVSRMLKACKNETEIEHSRKVMVKDGVAIAKAFYWLENTLNSRPVSEIAFSDKLAEYRSKQSDYVGESFGAIIGYRGNGAIIHYRPEEGKCANIEKDGILLADSGGQYMDGTTDITRTIALSPASDQQKKHFTLVLKGMIKLTRAKFPKGTTGGQLDTLARQFLWNEGLNYLHGTGHGVGFFLNVHEPPQGFGPINSERGQTVHVPGMVSSNEPGYYLEGEYGIRIENLVVAREAEEEGFLEFETLTLYPIDISLIDRSLMDKEEIEWLNAYHKETFDKISPLLSEDERAWFEKKCASIS